jgi:protease-3
MDLRRAFSFVLMLLFWATTAQAVITAPDDPRLFRAITLPQGTQVLLVHDPSATKAAAAVALPVGSLHDPASQQGLAHFLEHMLFLGSRHFPEPGAFQAFVEANGGQTNAMTAYGSTVYVFEAAPEALAEGLARLSDTLAYPLLDPAYVDKERHAVHAEMESKKFDDGRRLVMLTFSTLNPEHPATQFTGGNLETLADKPGSRLHEALSHFHATWYSAPLLRVVLTGPQSLDQLEAIARQTLEKLPVRAQTPPVITSPAVTPQETGVWVSIRPVRPMQLLRLDFVLPKNLDDRRTKPLELVAGVIGAETPGSLVEELRRQGLALSLSAGVDTESLGNAAVLSVTIQLTDQGARLRQAVAARCFHFFQRLARAPQDQWEKYFAQQRQLAALHFRYDPPGRGFDLAADLAGRMLRYPVEDALFGPYRMDALDWDRVQAVVRSLTPEHARIFSVDPTAATDRTAYFYGTPYAVQPITTDLLSAAPDSGTLPQPNPFVPTDLALRPHAPQTHPELVYAARGIHAWWTPSRFIHQPKVAMVLRATAPHRDTNARDAALAALWAEAWRQEQAGLRFMAQEAGLDLQVDADAEGLTVQVEGFQEHAPELLTAALGFLKTPVSATRFAQARAERVRSLRGEKSRGVFGQAMEQVYATLRAQTFSHEAVLEATQKLTPADLEAWRTHMLTRAAFQLLVVGNLSRTEAQAVADSVAHVVGFRDAAPTPLVRALPQKETALAIQRFVPLEDSAAVLTFFAPETSAATRARSMVAAELVSARFYHELRTEEQLGYIVAAFPVQTGYAAGIGFGVQSPVAGARQLTQRIQAFAQALPFSEVAGAFATVRQGLVDSLSAPPQTLGEEIGWLLRDLFLGNAAWNGKEQLRAALLFLTEKDLLEFWETAVRRGTGMRLAVEMSGTRHPDAPNPAALPDASAASGHLPTMRISPLW